MSDNPTNEGDGSTEPMPDVVDSSSPRVSDPGTSEPPAGRRKATKPGRFVRRHRILVAVGMVLVLLTGTGAGYLWWLNHQIGNIQRVDAGITEDPAKDGNEGGKPLNILLLGADNGYNQGGQSVADDMADGQWTKFVHRSDTMIIVHIPADRKSVQLVSIPRDTWVHINGYPYGNEHAKINAAFSYGGPSLARETVEQVTGIKIDHLAIIDWNGFKDLTSALGGIKVYIPQTFYDDSQRITWERGWHTFEGQDALAYVRTRHGLENGDFDRIARQQNFLRATMGKLLSSGTTRNPFKLTKVVGVITKYLTVDNTWDNSEIRGLALAMRSIHTEDVQFLTAPFGS
ncbi:MAG: LCP family protein, partial [Nocardioidaceae bacterium]